MNSAMETRDLMRSILIAVVVLLAAAFSSPAFCQGVDQAVLPASTGIPTWSGSFTYQTKTYHYSMVATAPTLVLDRIWIASEPRR